MVIRSSVDNILIATNGTNGQPGAPGTSSYIHIKYSNDGGETFTANSGETIGAYIGIYKDTIESDSTNVSDYQWKKIEGEDGKSAYTVILSNENFSISTDIDYIPIHTQSFTCNVTVLKGSNPADFTITASTDTENDIITTINGHTANITVATAEALSSSQGVITLTIVVTDGQDSQTFTKDITWSVAIQGRDGHGVSITDVTNYYLATLADSGVTKETSGWTTTIQNITDRNPYLWNYEVVTGSDGSTISSTEPVIIGRYGRDGAAAAEGRGIYSITEYYQVSSSKTTPPTTWSDTPIATDGTNKYLWNYETITYTDNTSEDTQKRVIGTQGETGTSGRGIVSITEYFLLSATDDASQITFPEVNDKHGWTTVGEALIWSKNKPYLWHCTEVVYENPSSTVYIDKYCDTSWKAANLVQSNLTDFQQGVDNVIDRDNQSIRSAVWENTYTYKPKTDAQGHYMYDDDGKIIPDTDNTKTMSEYMAEQIVNMDGITSRVSTTEANINGLQTKTSEVEQTADKINWLVKSGSSSSNVTLTDSAVTAMTNQFVVKDPNGSATIIEGGKINANSITADMITANNLQGDHGWINLKDGKFYYGDESTFTASDNAISWNGSKLQIKADEFLLASGKSIFDEIEAIETWFYATAPTTSNEPAKNWNTDNLKEMHLRDIYFDTSSGKSYRWAKDGNTYKWVEIEDKELAAVVGRLATAETNIQTNSEQIALRATKEELDSNYYTKTQTDSAITQKAGEIALNVTETKIAGIDIGGRNLLLKTAEAHTSAGSANGNVYITSYAQSDYLASAELVVNETVFALSFDYEVVGNTAENACFWPQFHGNAPTEANTIYSNTNHQDTSKVNMYVNDNPSGHYVIIFKVSSSQISGSANSNRVRLRNATDGATIKISNLKLELGNIATDWSPAPEDLESYVDTAIVTAKAEIKLTTDEIESEVSKKVGDDEVISKINQSAETVKIQASKVEIDGTAIFNDSDFKAAADAAYDAKGSAGNANAREQLIYISKTENTSSVNANTTWVTNSTGNQNVWTTKRPEYSQNYPVLFVATQRQTVAQSSGTTCTCTTPMIDDTITVIDGGKIITGTVTADQLNAKNINTSKILSVGAFQESEQANILNSKIAVPTVNLLPSVYYREYTSGKSWTSNGITFVVNNDGSVTATGTATADTSYAINEYKDSYAVPIMHIDNSKKYTLSGCPTGGSSTTYFLRGCCRADATSGTASNNYYDYGTGRTFTPGTEWIGFYIGIKSGYAIPSGGLTFYPQFEVGETANPYVSTHQGSGALRDTIDNIQVGGRNLLRHTKDFAESTYTSTCTFEKDAEGITVITFPAYTGSVGWKGCTFHPNIPYTLIRNKTVTLSFWYRSDSWTLASGGHDYPLPSFEILETATSNPSGTDRLKYVTIYDATVPAPTTEWQQFVRTYNITDNFFTAGSGTVTVDKYFTIQFFQHNLSHLQYKKFKLEIGNKATDWSPAPEDVEDNINNLGLSGKNLLTGTNTVTALTSTGTWANRTWRKGGSATGTITHIDVTDAPYSFITNGWQFDVTSVTDDADAHALLIAQNRVPVTGGKTYTMSCYARGTGKLYMFLGINSYTPAKAKQFTVTSGWQKYSHIITMPTGTSYVDDNGSNAFFGASINDTSIQICGMMLEEGDTATLWSPAPEDITSEEQRIYYRSSVSTKPNGNGLPTTWVTENTNKWNSVATNADGWSRKVTPISQNENDTDKYLYLYTCTQSRSVSGNVTYSEILLDDSTTVIDGGKIITGTVDTNQLNANAVTAEKIAVNAVTAEKIESHSISANHLNIGDNTNLAQANENIPNSLPGRVWNGTSYNEDGTSYNNNYKLNIQDGYLVKKSEKPEQQTYMMFTDFVPSSFRKDDELYYEFYAKAASATTISVNCWGYTEKYTGSVCSDYVTGINLTTDEKLISGTIQLTKEQWNTTAKYYLLGLNNNASTKVQISVRKVIFRKKNGGELIVDGSITANKIQGKSLSIGVFDTATQNSVLNSNLKVGGRNLIVNTNIIDLSSDATLPRIISQSVDTRHSGTITAAEHGIRTTVGSASRPAIRFGSDSADKATMNGLKAGGTYTISFDCTWKMISGLSSGTTSVMRVWIQDDRTTTGKLASSIVTTFGTATAGQEGSARCEGVFTIPDNVTMCNLYISAGNTSASSYAAGDYIELANIKLEEGNMASSWTAAPEDIDNDFNSSINEINETISGIQIGGRNLIRNTNKVSLATQSVCPNINGHYNDNSHDYGSVVGVSNAPLAVAEHGVIATATSAECPRVQFGVSTNGTADIERSRGCYGLIPGKTYTWSYDLRCDLFGAKKATSTAYVRSILYYGTEDAPSFVTNDDLWINAITYLSTEQGTEKFAHIEHTFTIPEDAIRIVLICRGNTTNTSYYATGDFLEMTNIKLEEGNRATAWTPAPEDFDSDIANVNSRVNETNEAISGLEQTVTGWLTFENAKLTIGQKEKNNIFRTEITGTEMSFWEDTTKVAYISNKELNITNAAVKENLTIGKFIFRPHESKDGGMSLIWS